MHVLSVVGPGAGDVVADLAPRLDGRVATVERRATPADPNAAGDDSTGGDDPTEGKAPSGVDPLGEADAHVALADDGTWSAAGRDRSFDDLLDSLAPDFDYALVAGFSRLRMPTVVIGDGTADDARADGTGVGVAGASETEGDAADATDARAGDDDVDVDVAGEVLVRVDDAADLDLDRLAADLDDLEPHVTLEELVARVKESPKAERSGAIATFTGRVRAKDSPDDPRTTHLAFEKYEGVAGERMASIARELEAREGVFDVRMHHRTGVIADGEDIVFVVVLAGHREEAFRTVEDGINRLKDEVPIFKKETTLEEEFWVHERA